MRVRAIEQRFEARGVCHEGAGNLLRYVGRSLPSEYEERFLLARDVCVCMCVCERGGEEGEKVLRGGWLVGQF